MKEKLKWIIIDYLDSLLRKYLRYRSKNSNYISYAKKEFNYAWGDYSKDEMQNWMADDILDLLSLLSMQGDSGSSFSYKSGVLTKLMRFKPISKLTFEDSEFNEPCGGGFYPSRQNKRNSAVFLKDNKLTYIDGFSKQSAYKYYDGKWSDGSEITWSGSVFVVRDNGSIYKIAGTVGIKNKETFTGKSFIIPYYEIECPKDWWIGFVKESDMKECLEEYDVIILENNIKDEISFKDGLYEKEIITAINSMCDLMGIKLDTTQLN